VKISVIIPVRNEEASIRALLESLLNQTLKPAEIVITDGGSTDATPEIISEYVKRGEPVRLIREGVALPGRGRNLAAAQASSEWIAFIDAGTRPESTWLQSLAEPAKTLSDIDVVYGSYEPITDTLFEECAAIAYVPPPVRTNGALMRPRSIVSVLMRISVWQAVGGFPEDLRSAEDLLFLNKIEAAGFRITFAPRAIVHGHIQPTLWKTFTRFVIYSRNNIRAGLWHSWQAKISTRYGLLLLLALPALFLGRFWLLLAVVPWLLMLAVRGVVAIVRNGDSYPAPLSRNLLRIVILVPLLAVIDLATMVGGIHWLLKDRTSLPGRNSVLAMALEGRRMLYICYFGVHEPLVQTQVLPYLRELAAAGVNVNLLTFEPRLRELWSEHQLNLQREQMGAESISWFYLPYHKRPTMPATIYDIIAGARLAVQLAKRAGIDVLHARAHVPMAMALWARRFVHVKLIFDIRGLMAEEYADAGIWSERSVTFSLVKRLERLGIRRADHIIVLTERLRDWLIAHQLKPAKQIAVIPCCVDFERFAETGTHAKDENRRSLGGDRFEVVYAGSLIGLYLVEEMGRFFAAIKRLRPEAFLRILSFSPPGPAAAALKRAGLDRSDFEIGPVPPEDIPTYLRRARLGVSFRKPTFAQIGASPTKVPEYLAAGLPVVCNSGIGDTDEIVEREQVGIVLREFDDDAYQRAAAQALVLTDNVEVRPRCERVAHQYFDLRTVGGPKYVKVYRQLFTASGGPNWH